MGGSSDSDTLICALDALARATGAMVSFLEVLSAKKYSFPATAP